MIYSELVFAKLFPGFNKEYRIKFIDLILYIDSSYEYSKNVVYWDFFMTCTLSAYVEKFFIPLFQLHPIFKRANGFVRKKFNSIYSINIFSLILEPAQDMLIFHLVNDFSLPIDIANTDSFIDKQVKIERALQEYGRSASLLDLNECFFKKNIAN